MNKGKSYKSLYLPAWTIVAAVLTLLLVISFSTYRNMSRERGRMEDSLIREGLVIIRAIEASLRARYPSSPPEIPHLQKLVEEVAHEPEVAAITIFDRSGNIVAASHQGAPLTEKFKGASSLAVLLKERGMITRYQEHKIPGGTQVFEVIEPFRPFAYPNSPLFNRMQASGKEIPATQLRQWAEDKMIALSLRLATFETARREDRHHTLLMGAILILLGTGALYFIFIVHNYYIVDRTLGRMKGYTENVVESMADGLISIDRERRVVTMNRQALHILGSSRNLVEGKEITDVLGKGIDEILGTGEGEGLVRDHEISVRRDPWGVIPVSLSATPLNDEKGRDIGSVLLIKDMREIRELQAKLRRSERMASLGRLAAGVAHEIRNPLSSIRGFAQYFVKRFQGQKDDEGYALVMVKEVDRLNRVITELLDFAGPKVPRLEPGDLAEIADHALKLLSSDLIARNVTVSREYEPELPAVSVDRDQISQVFLNLLLNAIESMEGGGEIRLDLRRSGPPPAVETVIADTGSGIHEDDLEKIFEPFFSRKRKGTGLGLAIVHQIIESHQGEIAVERGSEKGTIFRITLPVDAGDDLRHGYG